MSHTLLAHRLVRPAAGLAALLLLASGMPACAQTTVPATPAKPGTIEMPSDALVALLGITVHDEHGKEVGHLVDVLVDAEGRPRVAVLDVGGFLGVGNRQVAVEWSALHFNLAAKTPDVTLDMTSEEVKAAPAYEPAKPVRAMLPPAAPAAKP